MARSDLGGLWRAPHSRPKETPKHLYNSSAKVVACSMARVTTRARPRTTEGKEDGLPIEQAR